MKFSLIRKGMSLYWASGHRQIQTLGDIRLILPRFWVEEESLPYSTASKR